MSARGHGRDVHVSLLRHDGHHSAARCASIGGMRRLLTRIFWAGWWLDCPKEATKFVSAAVCLAFDEGFLWLFSVRGVPLTLLRRSLSQWRAVTRDLFCPSRCQNEVLSQPSLGRGCVWEVKHEVSPCPAILASIVHQSHRFMYVLGERHLRGNASKVTR